MAKLNRNVPSTIGSWSAAILRAIEAHGVDAPQLAREAGIDPESLEDPDARVPREALTRLWQLAVEATGDACFGLTATRYTAQTTFHALGYAVLASSTLKDSLERVIRYRRMVGDVLELRLEEAGDHYRLIIDVSAPPGAPFEAVDAVAALCVRQARLLCGDPRFSPTEVSLQRPAPADTEPFAKMFRCPVRFSQPCNSVEYKREDLERRLPAGNAELARQNDEVIVRYLARLETARVTNKVQQALLESLPDGAPSKETVARKLGMSARTLQRHLGDEGTSYKELLDAARMTLARNYIVEGRLSVTDIAFMVGFADTSTFSRAFKRWTGQSPSGYARR